MASSEHWEAQEGWTLPEESAGGDGLGKAAGDAAHEGHTHTAIQGLLETCLPPTLEL